jgi:hypothetical protein
MEDLSMKYLIIEKTIQGYRIKDSITDIQAHYIGYSLNGAIKQHRNNMNIKYKHLTKIFL